MIMVMRYFVLVGALLLAAGADAAITIPELAATYGPRDKVLTREMRAIDKQVSKLRRQRSRLSGKRAEERQSLGLEIDALHYLQSILRDEQKLIARIVAMDPDRWVKWRIYREADRQVEQFDFADKELAEKIEDVEWRRAAAMREAKSERVVAVLSRELATYKTARVAFERERSLYELMLTATGNPTLAEFRERNKQFAQRERARYEARRRQYSGPLFKSGGDTFAALVLAIGISAAVASVLENSESTASEKARAQRALDDARATARSQCVARGGDFIAGGGTAVGVCTK